MALRLDSPRLRAARRRRGGALVVALIVLTSLMVMSVSFLNLGSSSKQQIGGSVDDKAAALLAEAAVTEAVTALRAGATGNVGTRTTPALFGNGVFWVESALIADGRTRLTATALAGSGRAALEVVVGLGSEGRFPYVIACSEHLEVNSWGVIDSFDSSLGTYHDQLGADPFVNDNAQLNGNGYIKMKADSIVHGDAHPGPGEIVDLAGGSVTGSTTPSDDLLVLEAMTMPTTPPTGTLTVLNGTTLTLPPGVHSFSELKIENDATLIIEGPSTLIVHGPVQGKAGSSLICGDVGQPVDIYISGDVNLDSPVYVTTPGEDADIVSLYLLGADQSASLNADGRFYGTIYGPDAFVELKASVELMGAVACRELKMDSHAKIHYDEGLGGSGSAGESGEFPVLSWNPVAIDQDLASDRSDPFLLLDLDRTALPKPADAWDP